jgi:hypothetical protein
MSGQLPTVSLGSSSYLNKDNIADAVFHLTSSVACLAASQQTSRTDKIYRKFCMILPYVENGLGLRGALAPLLNHVEFVERELGQLEGRINKINQYLVENQEDPALAQLGKIVALTHYHFSIQSQATKQQLGAMKQHIVHLESSLDPHTQQPLHSDSVTSPAVSFSSTDTSKSQASAFALHSSSPVAQSQFLSSSSSSSSGTGASQTSAFALRPSSPVAQSQFLRFDSSSSSSSSSGTDASQTSAFAHTSPFDTSVVDPGVFQGFGAGPSTTSVSSTKGDSYGFDVLDDEFERLDHFDAQGGTSYPDASFSSFSASTSPSAVTQSMLFTPSAAYPDYSEPVQLTQYAESLCEMCQNLADEKLVELDEAVGAQLQDLPYMKDSKFQRAINRIFKKTYKKPVKAKILQLPSSARAVMYASVLTYVVDGTNAGQSFEGIDASLLKADPKKWVRAHYNHPRYRAALTYALQMVQMQIRSGQLNVDPVVASDE